MDRRTFLTLALAVPALARTEARTQTEKPVAPARSGGIPWTQWGGPHRNFQTEASGLKDSKPLGNAAQFDDRVGYTALLLQGQYPQKHMKGAQGTELCLYNKKSKTAYVAEWDSIRPAGKAN